MPGTLNSTENRTFTIRLFVNTACDPSRFGEGQTLIATVDVTTDGSGDPPFAQAVSLAAGQFVTATATDPAGDTSEFAQCTEVVAGGP